MFEDGNEKVIAFQGSQNAQEASLNTLLWYEGWLTPNDVVKDRYRAQFESVTGEAMNSTRMNLRASGLLKRCP